MSDIIPMLAKGDPRALVWILAGLVALLLIAWVNTMLRVRRLARQLSALTRGRSDRNLEEVLVSHLDTVEQTVCRMEALEQAVGILQAQLPMCLQKTRLVRYNAFDDIGGEQSFSLVLLDGRGDGLVVSSVHSRTDARIYAKAIQDGRATHPLSQEETTALRGEPGR